MSVATIEPLSPSASAFQYMFSTDGSKPLFSPTASSDGVVAFPTASENSVTINGHTIRLMLDSKSSPAIFYEGKIISTPLALKRIIEISGLKSTIPTRVDQTLLNRIAQVAHYLCGHSIQSVKSDSASFHQTTVKSGEKSKEICCLTFVAVEEEGETTKENTVTWDLIQETIHYEK